MTGNTKNWIGALLFFCLLADRASAVAFTLTVNIIGGGTVNTNPVNSSYPSGVNITLTAISNSPSWYFAGWSGDVVGTNNPVNTGMGSNKVVTATFQQLNTFTLSLATNGQGSITLSPTGSVYVSNTVVQATATPSAGWIFTSWSGAVNGNNNPASITMSTNKSLTGNFAQLPAFDTQPQRTTNTIGGNVTFTSHAVGSGISYQWYFSGAPLSGATSSSLTVNNVQLANAGNYYVVATNLYGSATSLTAPLVLTNAVVSTNALLVCDEGSLRAAIQIGGRIGVGCNGTIVLTNTIDIATNTILDASKVALTISGGGLVRQFNIAPGVSFTVTNLVIANGCISNNAEADGGAIYNNGGTLTLVSSMLLNNRANASSVNGSFLGPTVFSKGGAIYNTNGTLSVINCVFSNNIAGGMILGAVENRWDVRGGAIYSYNVTGSVTINNCTFVTNGCGPLTGGLNAGYAYGGALYQLFGSLDVTNCTFTANTTYGGQANTTSGYVEGPAYGGAMYADCVASLDHCNFFGNIARGGVANKFPQGGFGGAIYNHFILTIEGSSFGYNQALAGGQTIGSSDIAGQGGALFNANSLVLNHCSIYANFVQGSPGTYNLGFAAPGGSGDGAGIFNLSSLIATNCTIAGNTAFGGIGNHDFYPVVNGPAIGGGIFNSNGATATLVNVTIASNVCIAGGPGFSSINGFAGGNAIANSNGVAHLYNSIIAYSGTNGNVAGSVTDDGYNISDDASAVFNSGSSYILTDPHLGPLGTAPGITPTMPLLSNSPAIDSGTSIGAPNTDQRGYARPNGSGYDMGAYEYYAFIPPQINPVWTKTNSALTFTVYPPTTYRIQGSSNMLVWTDIETNGPFATVTNLSRSISKTNGLPFLRILCQ